VFEIAKTSHGYASTPPPCSASTGSPVTGPTVGAPFSGLIADAHGDLFSTTIRGGANGDYGTVFEITDSGFSTHKAPCCSVVESHDSFVFAPNLGGQTSTRFTVHNDTIYPPQSEFTQLAELLSHAHQDAVNPAHDAIDPMHHTATLSAQQAHHFLV
jgi:hypothetical protein